MEKNIWSEFAKSYDIILSNWSLYQELRDKIGCHLAGCNLILDQGCGTGIIALDLARKGKMVYGIDNNKEMLARAFENIDENICNNICLKEGDARNLEFADGYFDGVVSNNVLFYVNNPIAVMKEAHRVLKKEGIFIASGPLPNPCLEKLTQHITLEFKEKGIYKTLHKNLEHFVECSIKLKRTGMPNTFRAKELTGLFKENAGFSEVVEECEDLYLGQSYFIALKKI